MGFIKFILILIVAFYLLGLIGRLMLRMLLKRMERNMNNMNAGQNQGGYYYKQYQWGASSKNEEQTKEGEVKISESDKHKKINEKVGDYIDYEEVKE